METAGSCDLDVKGEGQVKNSKVQSTDARHSDGLTCNSVEVPVMGAEQRRQVVLLMYAPTRLRRSA